MDQYLYIPFLGDEHPFTSYFDVHQGDRVLTHPHIIPYYSIFQWVSKHGIFASSRQNVGAMGMNINSVVVILIFMVSFNRY